MCKKNTTRKVAQDTHFIFHWHGFCLPIGSKNGTLTSPTGTNSHLSWKQKQNKRMAWLKVRVPEQRWSWENWLSILKWTNYYKASIIITSASRGVFGNAAPLRGRSLRKLSRTRRLAQLGKCDKSGMVQNCCNRKVAELLAIMNGSDYIRDD